VRVADLPPGELGLALPAGGDDRDMAGAVSFRLNSTRD
jgi:hypothetical protein